MTTTFNVPLDWEAIDPILVAILKDELNSLRTSWDHVRHSGKGHVFSHDAHEDMAQINDLIGAYLKVLEHHGVTTC